MACILSFSESWLNQGLITTLLNTYSFNNCVFEQINHYYRKPVMFVLIEIIILRLI